MSWVRPLLVPQDPGAPLGASVNQLFVPWNKVLYPILEHTFLPRVGKLKQSLESYLNFFFLSFFLFFLGSEFLLEFSRKPPDLMGGTWKFHPAWQRRFGAFRHFFLRRRTSDSEYGGRVFWDFCVWFMKEGFPLRCGWEFVLQRKGKVVSCSRSRPIDSHPSRIVWHFRSSKKMVLFRPFCRNFFSEAFR